MNIAGPSVFMLRGTILKNSEKLSRLCHPLLCEAENFLNDPRRYGMGLVVTNEAENFLNYPRRYGIGRVVTNKENRADTM